MSEHSSTPPSCVSTDGQYWNQIDYILCSQRWRSSIQSAKTRLGADCGSDHELLIAKLRLKSKKVGKTTRPFRYDLNQIPYNYTVEVTNRFKGLDLIDRVPEELWTEVPDMYRRQASRTNPKEKKCKSRKSSDTWSNRQIWSWSTKRSRSKANRVFPRKCTGHPLLTTQEKTLYTDITRWSKLNSDWLYPLQPKMEKFYTVSKNKTGSWLWLRSWIYCKIQNYIEESRENL